MTKTKIDWWGSAPKPTLLSGEPFREPLWDEGCCSSNTVLSYQCLLDTPSSRLLIKEVNNMKSTINERKQAIGFPCLKVHKDRGFVVLFSDENNGVTVASHNGWGRIGSLTDWLTLDSFVSFTGSITLEDGNENE